MELLKDDVFKTLKVFEQIKIQLACISYKSGTSISESFASAIGRPKFEVSTESSFSKSVTGIIIFLAILLPLMFALSLWAYIKHKRQSEEL